MGELDTLQVQFGRGLDAPSADAATLDLFVGEKEQVGRRLGVYRGNAAANAAKALAAAYPVVEKIVGAEFFSRLASEYRRRHPSADGDLNEYGEAFAAFLGGFAPAAEIFYLADVAQLEWRVHRAHYAADSAPFDPARLAAVAPAQQLNLRPRLHAACDVLRSAFPVARIWEIHQPSFTGRFDVEFTGGATHALVYRPRFRVEVAQIGDAEAAFLGAVLESQTLGAALAVAQTCNAAFDLGRSLNEWVQSSIIVSFNMDGD